MSKKNHEQNFRKMWRWLAITGIDDKEEARLVLGLPEAHSDCDACEAVFMFSGATNDEDIQCSYCPVSWSSSTGTCYDVGGEFRSWHDSKTQAERIWWATIIAGLPWEEKDNGN